MNNFVEKIVITKESVTMELVNAILDFLVNYVKILNVPSNAIQMELV
jgi:hypothetical protein